MKKKYLMFMFVMLASISATASPRAACGFYDLANSKSVGWDLQVIESQRQYETNFDQIIGQFHVIGNIRADKGYGQSSAFFHTEVSNSQGTLLVIDSTGSVNTKVFVSGKEAGRLSCEFSP